MNPIPHPSARRAPPVAAITVGVMGSGAEEHNALAEPLGELLARLGVNLLTGGGPGVMTSVSRSFTRSSRTTGVCIGVIPCLDAAHRNVPKPGYPNPFVELPIFTHLALSGTLGWENQSRNHINVLSSNLIVALPGGAGTHSEVELALTYSRPVALFHGEAAEPEPFPAVIPRLKRIDEVEAWLSPQLFTRPATLAGIAGDYVSG